MGVNYGIRLLIYEGFIQIFKDGIDWEFINYDSPPT
jgi:hypothetical protein